MAVVVFPLGDLGLGLGLAFAEAEAAGGLEPVAGEGAGEAGDLKFGDCEGEDWRRRWVRMVRVGRRRWRRGMLGWLMWVLVLVIPLFWGRDWGRRLVSGVFMRCSD